MQIQPHKPLFFVFLQQVRSILVRIWILLLKFGNALRAATGAWFSIERLLLYYQIGAATYISLAFAIAKFFNSLENSNASFEAQYGDLPPPLYDLCLLYDKDLKFASSKDLNLDERARNFFFDFLSKHDYQLQLKLQNFNLNDHQEHHPHISQLINLRINDLEIQIPADELKTNEKIIYFLLLKYIDRIFSETTSTDVNLYRGKIVELREYFGDSFNIHSPANRRFYDLFRKQQLPGGNLNDWCETLKRIAQKILQIEDQSFSEVLTKNETPNLIAILLMGRRRNANLYYLKNLDIWPMQAFFRDTIALIPIWCTHIALAFGAAYTAESVILFFSLSGTAAIALTIILGLLGLISSIATNPRDYFKFLAGFGREFDLHTFQDCCINYFQKLRTHLKDTVFLLMAGLISFSVSAFSYMALEQHFYHLIVFLVSVSGSPMMNVLAKAVWLEPMCMGVALLIVVGSGLGYWIYSLRKLVHSFKPISIEDRELAKQQSAWDYFLHVCGISTVVSTVANTVFTINYKFNFPLAIVFGLASLFVTVSSTAHRLVVECLRWIEHLFSLSNTSTASQYGEPAIEPPTSNLTVSPQTNINRHNANYSRVISQSPGENHVLPRGGTSPNFSHSGH